MSLRPKVMVQNAVSVDGRLDWIQVDMGTFYGVALQWKEDATLAGSDTILSNGELPTDAEDVAPFPQAHCDDKRPVLVIPDSRGRVRCWGALLGAGIWKAGIALCSSRTPSEYFDYLGRIGVQVIVEGEAHVDLGRSLERLYSEFGLRRVRVDSGGILSGVMFRAGLIDELCIMLLPYLIGGSSNKSIFRANDLTSMEGIVHLELMDVSRLEGGIVLLRYTFDRK